MLLHLAGRISLCGPLNSKVCLHRNCLPLFEPRVKYKNMLRVVLAQIYGHTNPRGKTRSVTYSTDPENEVGTSYIFLYNLSLMKSCFCDVKRLELTGKFKTIPCICASLIRSPSSLLSCYHLFQKGCIYWSVL